MTVIKKQKDLKTLLFEQLLRALITHEMMLGDEQSKKKKGVALKVTKETEEETEDEDGYAY